MTVHWRWGDVWIGGRIGQRWKENSPWVFLKLGDRTTVKDWRWGGLGVIRVGRNRRLLHSGGSAFGSRFGSWRNRRLVRRWSAFGTLVDRRLVRWSAFSLLCDRRLDRSFSSSLSLLFAEFFLFVALSLSFARVRKMFKGKNDSVKWFPGQMRQILVKRKLFSGNSIFRSCQTCGFYGKWFSETVFSQFKHSLSRKDGIY